MGCCGSREPGGSGNNMEKRKNALADAEAVLANPNASNEQKEEALRRIQEATLLRGGTHGGSTSTNEGGSLSSAYTQSGPTADALRAVSPADVTITMAGAASPSASAAPAPAAAAGVTPDYGSPDLTTTRGPAKSMMVNAPRMSDDPNSGLYHYRRIKQLADGGTCIVFKVQSEENYGRNRIFHACKLLSRANPKVEEISRRLWAVEAKMLQTVKMHANILQHSASFEDSRYFVIVTSFYDGGELFDKLYEVTYSEQDAVVWMKQILYAIQSLHSYNIVHRDIKPENFVLESTQKAARIRLIDFGGALQGDPDMEVKDIVATPSFVAPEVLDDTQKRSIKTWKASDIWSCGVILYVMLTGSLPFEGNTQKEVFRRIAAAQYNLPPDSADFKLSFAARDLIARMLDRDWTKRPTVAECLVHSWIAGNTALAEKMPERVLRSLVGFSSQSKLRKLVAKVLAHQMKQNDKGRLDGLFQKYDKDGDGTIGQQEAADMLKKIGAGEQSLGRLLNNIDENGDGSITKDEFFFAQALGELGIDDAKIDSMFNYFDGDADGYVTLADIVRRCGLQDEDEAKRALAAIDVNRDGKITRAEWRLAMKDVGFKGSAVNHPHRQSVAGYEFSPATRTAAQRQQEQATSRPTSRSELVVTSAIKKQLSGGAEVSNGISAANNAALDAALAANPGRQGTKAQTAQHKTNDW